MGRVGWEGLSPTSEMLPRFLASVFFANHGECAEFHNATEHACSYLWTSRVITEVFRQYLFVAVLGLDARFYGYKRNGSPSRPVACFCESILRITGCLSK